MAPNKVSWITLLSLTCVFTASQAQDVLRKDRITALKGLRELAVVFRPKAESEVLTSRELADLMTLGLKQKAPRLKEIRHEKAQSWLELSYITYQQGGLVELSLYRWVRLVDTGESIFAKVWNDQRVVLGGFPREEFKDVLDTLLTSFGADYARANP